MMCTKSSSRHGSSRSSSHSKSTARKAASLKEKIAALKAERQMLEVRHEGERAELKAFHDSKDAELKAFWSRKIEIHAASWDRKLGPDAASHSTGVTSSGTFSEDLFCDSSANHLPCDHSLLPASESVPTVSEVITSVTAPEVAVPTLQLREYVVPPLVYDSSDLSLLPASESVPTVSEVITSVTAPEVAVTTLQLHEHVVPPFVVCDSYVSAATEVKLLSCEVIVPNVIPMNIACDSNVSVAQDVTSSQISVQRVPPPMVLCRQENSIAAPEVVSSSIRLPEVSVPPNDSTSVSSEVMSPCQLPMKTVSPPMDRVSDPNYNVVPKDMTQLSPRSVSLHLTKDRFCDSNVALEVLTPSCQLLVRFIRDLNCILPHNELEFRKHGKPLCLSLDDRFILVHVSFQPP